MEHDITYVPSGEIYRFKKSRKKPKYMGRDNYYVLDKYEHCYMLQITGMRASFIINIVTKDKVYHDIIDLGEYGNFYFHRVRNPHTRYAKIMLERCEHVFVMNKLVNAGKAN